jgi:7-carboxy-7-deazaguanine synthase
MLLVNEIYGPVKQGEGRTAGLEVLFLRTSGCNLACSWCDSILKGTLVRDSNNRWVPIEQIEVGTSILGVEQEESHRLQRRYFYSEAVSRHLISHKELQAIKFTFSNGVQITSTFNHQFFVRRQNPSTHYTKNWKWKWIEASSLMEGDKLWSIGKPAAVAETDDFVTGWLTGYTSGDGWIDLSRKTSEGQWNTITPEIKERLVSFLEKKGYKPGFSESFYTTKKSKLKRKLFSIYANGYVNQVLENSEWERGFVSGFFDAEGSNSATQAIFSNKNLPLLHKVEKTLITLGYDTKIDLGDDKNHNLIVACSLAKRLEFDAYFCYAKPHYRKWLWNEPDIRGGKSKYSRRIGKDKQIVTIESIEVLAGEFEFYDINSTSGNFFANGVLVHNTPYTWNWTGTKFVHPDKYDKYKEVRKMDTYAIKQELYSKGKGLHNLVISGGEPMLQQRSILYLIRDLNRVQSSPWHVEIETNGTIVPDDKLIEIVTQFNCSPKTGNSGPDNPYKKRINLAALLKLAACGEKTTFKFVVQSATDANEIREIINLAKIKPDQIWVMSEGKTREEQLARESETKLLAESNGYHFSPRLQVLEFGDKRAV